MTSLPPGDNAIIQKLEAEILQYKKNEEDYRLLFDRAPIAYQSLDNKGCFFAVNQAWLDTFGYSREEVIGQPFENFLPQEWKNHFKENFPRFKSVGEILGVEFSMIKKDRNPVKVSF
ncbi:MAG: PAS domain S-box protein, partial [Proteobacteria bacterium]|nr:PAS domain S-box protein [Pseudomonadota bacterium]MBU1710788.1 PAS domain S-box protein [Pseudomonadota bacterium]